MTLFKESLSDYLTAGPHDRAARDTFPGMAHWAGSGPSLKTCRECLSWDHQFEYHTKRGKFGGLIKPARCKKFRALAGKHGDEVPDDAAACKHFTNAAIVPARFAGR